MQRKAKDLKLPFNLSFVVGGNGWVPNAFTPMMEALAPGIFNSWMLVFLGMNQRGLVSHLILIYVLFVHAYCRHADRNGCIGLVL